MSIITYPDPITTPPGVPFELRNGDRLTREEFHRLYKQTPREVKAELIGGIVYMASPLKRRHGTQHVTLGTLFRIYVGHTPGVETGDNSTIFLGKDSEPQPDLYLRILPECGGQSTTTREDYIAGAPELVAEVADSSRSIDLHAKHDDYRRYGVLEYVVISLREPEVYWFDLAANRPLKPNKDGIVQMQTMPGLWIDVAGLLNGEFDRLMATLNAGLATPEHKEFAEKLGAKSSS